MPAIDFTKSILVVTPLVDGTDWDSAVMTTTREEEFLLIQSCVPVVEQPAPDKYFLPGGRNILTVYQPGQLSWQVEASVLEWDGLADYHPGAALSRRLLPFDNAASRRPFQFSDGAVLVYESPRLTAPAGGLPTIAFTIAEQLGLGLDTVAFPALSGSTTPSVFVEIPAQDPVELATPAEEALLRDVFHSLDAFADAPVLAQLFVGAPASGGIALTGEVEIADWTFSEPDAPYITEALTDADIDWEDVAAYERTGTHVRISRNGVVLRDLTLASPIVIPAAQGIRIPAGHLGLLLTWPFDGTATPPTAADRPSRHFLGYVLGGVRATFLPSTELTVSFRDDDYGTPVEYDTLEIPAHPDFWTITGRTVAPVFTNTNAAPSGGWSILVVHVSLYGGTAVALREECSISVAEDALITLSGTPALDLTAAPD